MGAGDDFTSDDGTPTLPDAVPIDQAIAEQTARFEMTGTIPVSEEQLPAAPERASLPDDELAALLTSSDEAEAGTLSKIEQLEEQLTLRQEEAIRYREWESELKAIGTPAAAAMLERVAPDFADAALLAPVEEATVPGVPVPEPVVMDIPDAPVEASSEEAIVPLARIAEAEFAEIAAADGEADAEADREEAVEISLAAIAAVVADVESETELDDEPVSEDETELADEPVSEDETEDELQDEPEAAAVTYAALMAQLSGTPETATDPVDASTDESADEAVDAVDGEERLDTDSLLLGAALAAVGVAANPELPARDPEATVQADLAELTDENLLVEEPVALEEPVAVEETGAGTEDSAETEPEHQEPPGFGVELAGIEPTELDRRVGRSTRLFWMWFSVNASLVSLAGGALLFSLGLNLRQSIMATLLGLAVSFLPLALGTLAGKWSGQPTMVVSRATFGLVGNILPALLAIITRAFWAVVLLWLLSTTTMQLVEAAGFTGSLSSWEIGLIALAVAFVAMLVIAFFGYRILAVIQAIVSIGSAVLIAVLIALTWQYVDLDIAITAADGSWWLLLTGSVLVFSLVGLAWAQSSSDLARYQRPSSSGGAAMLSASFGATIAPFVLISYGALLAASNEDLAEGLLVDPVAAIAGLLPSWYPVPLLLALGLSLLAGSALALYSGGFALQNIGFRISRQGAVLPVALIVGAGAALLVFFRIDFGVWLLDLSTALAVPVAAWAGIFCGEMMLRMRRFDSQGLVHRGGSYADFRWVNLGGLVIASAIGFGFTSGEMPGLDWQGYLISLFDDALPAELLTSDVGVYLALALGLITALAFGLGPIRRQEGGRRRVVTAAADL